MISLAPLAVTMAVERVDFDTLLPTGRACECKGCRAVQIPYAYSQTTSEAKLPTDHSALFGGWDGYDQREDRIAQGCVSNTLRMARFGPFSADPASWHWVNSSQIDHKLLWPGDRVKGYVGHLVTPEGEPVSVPPLHAHHIHIAERVNLQQTDFHLWETHGDFSIGSTYGIGDISTKGYQKVLPAPYTAPVHAGAKIWVYSVINDVRTWVEGAESAIETADHRGTPGMAQQSMAGSSVSREAAAKDVESTYGSVPAATRAAVVDKAFAASDQDSDGRLDAREYKVFLQAVAAVAAEGGGGSEWIAASGTDTTPAHKLHGVGPIEFYLEVAFAIETDLTEAEDVVAFGFRSPWPCSEEGRLWKQRDAFYRVATPNYPALMIWTSVMPLSGRALSSPVWSHSHHLRTYGHAILRGALPNTRSTCDRLGITVDPVTGLPDGTDWHATADIRASFDSFVSFPGHDVVCQSNPDKATNVEIWTNSADGIKPGTHFDRALELSCIDDLTFEKGDHFTPAFFAAPMFEPEPEVIGMHMDVWFFIAPTEEVVMDLDHGIFKPKLDDCALTCGNDKPSFTRKQLDALDFYNPDFANLDLTAARGAASLKAPSASAAVRPAASPLAIVAVGSLLVALFLGLAALSASRRAARARGEQGAADDVALV